MDFEKLKREEDEAIARLYGNKDEEVETVENLNEDADDSDEEIEEIEFTPTTQEEAESTQQRKPTTSWKKRYATYKATTDNTIYQLRKDLAQQKSTEADLRSKVDDAYNRMRELEKNLLSKVDPYEGVFTKEDEEVIGTEAVDIIKKAMKAKGPDEGLTKLEQEIAELKKERNLALKKDFEDMKAKSFADLKVKLTNLVPEWSVIDTDPKFNDFINGIDSASGSFRKPLFTNAVDTGDVKNVARFYQEYQDSKPKSRDEILASKVTPVGDGSSSHEVPTPKKTYRIAEYNQFMDEVIKGKWKNRSKEAKIKERQFDLAFIEGRVTN